MEYVSAEEFLKQSKEVQNVFLDWWKPSIGEMMYSTGITSGECIYLEDYKESGYEIFRLKSKGKALTAKNIFIPLLTEGQLRSFILNHFNSLDNRVELEWCNDGYAINIVSKINDEKVFREFYTSETEPIKAYWEVACKIISE